MYEGYKFFKDRPEYSDVKPIPQDDDPREIIKIAYSDQFIDCHDYLRGLMATNELSDRALVVTTEALLLNTANFTTWAYRRNIFSNITYDYSKELDFVSSIIRENSKNYQVWYHRQWVLNQVSQVDKSESFIPTELDFIKDIIEEDNKNYHAWQHLRWFIDHFPVCRDEQLAYSTDLINEDVFNNSVWNYRFYLCFDNDFQEDVINREIDFVKEKILKCPNNDSSWNYLYGIINPNVQLEYDKSTVKMPSKQLEKVRDFLLELENSKEISETCTQYLSFMVEFYFDDLTLTISREDYKSDPKNKTHASLLQAKAVDMCMTLESEIDKVRENYWNYRRKQIESICI